MIPRKHIAAIALGLVPGLSTAAAQTCIWSDTFDSPLEGWSPYNGQISAVSQQFVVSGSFGAMQTNTPLATYASGFHAIPTSGPLPDNQTLELRADLVGVSENDAWAGLHFFWLSQGQGYVCFMDQDEIGICKYYNGAGSLAWFFSESRPLPNEYVTLGLALTRRGSNIEITTRIFDKHNSNAVVFERTVIDTPQADPVLPSGTVRGSRSEPDVPGTPWPVLGAPTHVTLSVQWANPDRAPQATTQVTYDNLGVCQYESPRLVIYNAVVLCWPVTSGQFILERAASVEGPWEPVPDPWWRTNAAQNEVCILAPESLKLFRLRFAP